MAGLEDLVSIIYHEKQQSGSALCAQHALNNLLQGNYFSAPDLSDIAANLDLLERSYRSGGSENGNDSMNMDDTGFFSIQVMENALKVWGLNLVRWRSEEFSRYHDRPHVQLAFILNLEQHWFTLRRFGNAEAAVDKDPGHGHWFNLNSFLKSPEWVGRVYLSLVLEQAEQEGYSVFAVVQADSSTPLALPRTEADIIAAALPEPSNTSSSYTGQMLRHGKNPGEVPDGFEEEDFELQAALQASLGGYGYHGLQNHGGNEPGPSNTREISQDNSEPLNEDPVVTSMERNKLMLQRMRQQQEYAQREAWSYTTEGMTPEQIAAEEARREARRKQEEEEEENLQRAIAESEAMARHNNQNSQASDDARGGFSDVQPHNLHSDDNDAELQAALRASLEQANGILSTSHSGQAGVPVPELHHDDSSVLSDGMNSVEPLELPTIEEMRRKRLAKFGA